MSSKLLRAYPQSIEAERALLCSLFLDNSKIGDILEVIDVRDFYDERNASIFEAIKELYEENAPFDFVTVPNKLKEKDSLDKIGIEYIAGVIDYLPAPANAYYYAQIIYKKSILRALIEISSDIANVCYEEPEEIEDVLNLAEKKIFEISSKKSNKYFSVDEMTDETLEYIEALRKRKTVLTGVPSGFNDLDRMTNGFQNGDLIIIAGRPSMGKTAFVLNAALNAAVEHSKRIGVFNLEMTAKQLILRMLSSLSGVGVYNLRTGFLDNSQMDSVVMALDKLKKVKVYIDDTSFLTVADIRTKARKMKMEKDIDMLIVDYLQLIQGLGNSSNKNRTQEISEISRSLKILAKELDIPIVALSQLNRAVEARDDKRPMMADLRESGAIEQDADVIMFIYRDEVYNRNKEDNKGKAEIIIGKQRNGPIGTIELQFEKEMAAFRNLSKEGGFVEKRLPQ
jgi:replicative DNA helicase